MSDRRAINAGSISVPFDRTRLLSKCSARDAQKRHDFSRLQEIHQIDAVIRSGEYRPSETASGPPGSRGSAQPLPHNPRKQRKNPATAGSGERFRGGKWRSGRDSNPRDGFPPAPLAGVCLRPLGHHSAGGSISGRGRRTRVNRSICRMFVTRTGGTRRPLPPRSAHPAAEKPIHLAPTKQIRSIEEALRRGALRSTNHKPRPSAPFRRRVPGHRAAPPRSSTPRQSTPSRRRYRATQFTVPPSGPRAATHRAGPPPQALNRKCSTSPSCTS